MADDAPTVPNRTTMTLPGAAYVIEVPEDQVEHRLAMGWKKVRGKRADTGSVPVQRADPR